MHHLFSRRHQAGIADVIAEASEQLKRIADVLEAQQQQQKAEAPPPAKKAKPSSRKHELLGGDVDTIESLKEIISGQGHGVIMCGRIGCANQINEDEPFNECDQCCGARICPECSECPHNEKSGCLCEWAESE